jgi:hypothetical protein
MKYLDDMGNDVTIYVQNLERKAASIVVKVAVMDLPEVKDALNKAQKTIEEQQERIRVLEAKLDAVKSKRR